jgi:hypothetical protein
LSIEKMPQSDILFNVVLCAQKSFESKLKRSKVRKIGYETKKVPTCKTRKVRLSPPKSGEMKAWSKR